MSGRLRRLWVVAALLAAVGLSYAGVLRNGFVDFDDQQYITDNAMVRQGLTSEGIAWAFTTTYAANWHPLTWISHMADVQIFGLDPRGHHAVGLLLHAANACLVLVALHALTGAFWRSAAAAALFALHPLHVESVAWAAERKDLLSTLLALLALLAYLRHARRPGAARLVLVTAVFAVGLLAKPMLVTLPFLLLLLDFWPLGRIGPSGGAAGRERETTVARRLIGEKIPLFVLAAASSGITYFVQRQDGAIDSTRTLAERAATAVAGYGGYLGRMLWPRDLSFFYPQPETGRPAAETAGALLLLATITALCLTGFRRRPYLPVGWFWYLGTLVPVIGLVQAGSQAMADRYTYIPLTGLFVLAVWLAADLSTGLRFRKTGLAAVALATLVPLGLATHDQVARWHNTPTLMSSVPMGLNSWVALLASGKRLARAGKLDEAIAAYGEAIRHNPASDAAYCGMGAALSRKGLRHEAVAAYRQALRFNPDNVDANVNLGAELAEAGNLSGAIEHFEKALTISPDPAAKANLAIARRQLQLHRAGRR